MTVLHLLNKEDYETVVKSSKFVLLHFFADWVKQCEHINNILEEMVKQSDYKDVRFSKILAEQVPEVSLMHQISAVPTMVIIRNGKEVDRVEGSYPNQLIEKLTSQLMKSDDAAPSKFTSSIKPSGVDLNQRIKSLINAAQVMLFMKGNPSQPRCGFSRQIIEILNSHNAEYKTFDILSDSEVREGLKKYSNWPTYPQLYINGELVGGLDIIKELVANNELVPMLPNTTEALNQRLKSLLNKSKVMVFIKGNRDNPKCGFSRQLINILNQSSAKYETFDILEDENVRQGLKQYSNWPTYPQLYVNGKLVGGLDIVKEHQENGELPEILDMKK